MTIYFPRKHLRQDPVEALRRLAKLRDRSVNYLIVQAIMQYLDREEAKGSA